MVRIDLMGPFAAATDDGPVAFEARSAAALVAYMALVRGRTVSRDAAAAALWPEHEPTSARTNLRKAIQRVRKATAGVDLLDAEGEILRLVDAETDLDRADRLHRTFVLAARLPDGTAALAQEWKIRERRLLDGWEDEWIEAHRVRAEMLATELAIELAQAEEATGDLHAALRVWRGVLSRVPHHAQALQSTLRLEAALNGPERAAELARKARLYFRDELGVAMPAALGHAIREFGLGAMEPVPPPDNLRKRSELYLLARMFESNLRANRGEALALLVQEVGFPTVFAHPRTCLSLLTLALELTEGASDDRLAVARRALVAAALASEYEVGRRWADFILGALPATDPRHAPALNYKGFMAFEQRDYEEARTCLEASVRGHEGMGNPDEALRVRVSLAAVQWHTGDYEAAVEVYEEAIRRFEGQEGMGMTLAAIHGNLCFVYTALERWEEAIDVGRRCVGSTEGRGTVATWAPSGALGLALFMAGERAEGTRWLRSALAATLREGMVRYNQIELDYAVVLLARAGRTPVARLLLQAAVERRAALRHVHAPAELRLIRSVAGLDPEAPPTEGNPLLGQSAATLSEWACEELDRLGAA